jgi:hypothetical protein
MTSNTCSGQEFPDTGIVYSVMSFSLKFERNLILRSPGNGRIAASDIGAMMSAYVPSITALCSDAEAPYRKFAKEAGIEHHEINAKAGVRVKKGWGYFTSSTSTATTAASRVGCGGSMESQPGG